jgi:hypothetical protein
MLANHPDQFAAAGVAFKQLFRAQPVDNPEIGEPLNGLPIDNVTVLSAPPSSGGDMEQLTLQIEGKGLFDVGIEPLKTALLKSTASLPLLKAHAEAAQHDLSGWSVPVTKTRDEVNALMDKAGEIFTAEEKDKILSWEGFNPKDDMPYINVTETETDCISASFFIETEKDPDADISATKTIADDIVMHRPAIMASVMKGVESLNEAHITKDGQPLFNAAEMQQLKATEFDVSDKGEGITLFFGVPKADAAPNAKAEDRYDATPMNKLNLEKLTPIIVDAVLNHATDKAKSYASLADSKTVLRHLKAKFEGTGVDISAIEKADMFRDWQAREASKETEPQAIKFERNWTNPKIL